ncbi:MAG: peptide-methionine (S)-S-oxide reductase MsrA [Nitrospirae bacterium]|nr:peptide-methionine (S)-S-oxide reductase MsrA [Candidatus Troglogloeales bacterium]
MEKITLGGGCFWCLEAVFSKLNGVESVLSGYCGGHFPSPTYSQVCSGTTGHAEVIEILLNPEVISLTEILEIFFLLHDPTTLNRQGADAGTQYRSAIFYHTETQREISLDVIARTHAAGIWKEPIVTEVTPIPAFYPAEDYHQKYYERNPNQGYCRAVIAPKMTKLQKLFLEKIKK